MSCSNCEKSQDSGAVAYYRWKIANIGLTGCSEHLKEVIKVLNDYQFPKPSSENQGGSE